MKDSWSIKSMEYFNFMENKRGISSRNVNKANIISSDNPENFQIMIMIVYIFLINHLVL